LRVRCSPAVKNNARSTRPPPSRERSAASAWSISNPDILVPQEGHYEGGVPAPRTPLLRYHGVLAPAAAWRPLIVPRPIEGGAADASAGLAGESAVGRSPSPSGPPRSARPDGAALLK
jgi:hypothetical protein